MKIKLIVISTAVLGLALGGFVFLDEISGKIRAWRYQDNIEDAREALAQGATNEVVRLTGAALRLTSGSIHEIRELFSLAAAVRSAESLGLGEALFTHEDGTTEDRISVLEFVAEENETFFLEALLGRFDEAELREPEVVAVRVKHLLVKSDRLSALLLMDSLSEEDLELAFLRALRGELLAGERGNPLAWKSCRQLVTQLMSEPGEGEPLAAFRSLFLLPDRELKKVFEPDLMSWIKGQAEAKPSDVLAAAHWKLLRSPEQEEAVVKEVLALVKEAPDEVARWMLAHDQKKMILEQDLDLSSEDTYSFYLARLQYFFNEESWESAEVLLQKPHRSMKDSLHSGLQSAVAMRRDNEVAHVALLQKALNHATRSENFNEFLSLIEIGERLEDEVMKRKACEQMVLLPSRFLPGGEHLGFLEIEFGAEPAFLATLYQNLHAAKPNDPVVNYRKALVDFVIGAETEASIKALDSLLEDYPAAISLRCAKALLLAEESVTGALALIEEEEGNRPNLDGAFEIAVYQALLRRNGEIERANRLERLVDWSILPAYLRPLLKPPVGKTVSK